MVLMTNSRVSEAERGPASLGCNMGALVCMMHMLGTKREGGASQSSDGR